MEFQDTVPLGGANGAPGASDPVNTPAAPAPGAGPAAAGLTEQRLAIRFTGSGSEYFRIWIVNLLLVIVTLGFYYPFAKVRRLRYFHANTLVGEQALGFHGNPWAMLRGYVLMLVFGAAYAGAGYVSPTAGVVAVAALAALWPALWRASLRFRLASTSWRGLRLGFTGSTAGAYRALAPMLLPVAVFLAFTTAHRDPAGAEPSGLAVSLLGLAMLALMTLSPMGIAWIKRYQHGHYRFAGEQSTLAARTSSFYGVALLTMLVSFIPLALLLVAGVAAAFMGNSGGKGPNIVFLGLATAAFYLSIFVVTQPFYQAQLQNLVWGQTRSPHLRFDSALAFRPLAWLTCKNLLLMVITLGLYRPFAVVHTSRLRLEAVSLHASGDLDAWTATAVQGQQDVAGDAAGDLLGIDIGL